MVNSQPPHQTISKSQYWFAKVVPLLYMTGITLALPTVLKPEFVQPELSEQREEQLQQQIRAIGIKVMAQGETVGSGILLTQANRVYTVVTNAHVIQAGTAPFQVQTPDGQTYAAALITPPVGQNQDIGILRFQSPDRDYPTAKLATTPLKIGDRVWAAGYPLDRGLSPMANRASDTENNLDAWGLMISKGQISHLLPKPLLGGYTIGYDNSIKKGMSGGPLLNQQGELVGVNGIHANPLWDAPETLADGSLVSIPLQEQINESNWAIPISVLNNYLNHIQ